MARFALRPLRRARRARGFAYLLLLLAITGIGLASTAAATLGARMARAEAERHLLDVGSAFQTALETYALTAPVGASRQPRELQDLLLDPRLPGIKRHLRRVYEDPLTGRQEWGLRRDSSGAIVGVYSLAPGRPIKRTGFEFWQAHFEEAESYSGWTFGAPSTLVR